MKRFVLAFSLLSGFFLFTSSTDKLDFSYFLNLLGNEPVLPDQPFDYKNIEFPEHIVEEVGQWSTGSFNPNSITNNISNDGATLGRVLFYDKILSADNSLSCASCHKQEFAFADDVALSEGFEGALTTRNSPNLNDIEWAINSQTIPIIFFPPNFTDQHFLFWDGRVSTLDSLVLLPVINQDELNGDLSMIIDKMETTTYYPGLFQKAFGTPQITEERMSIALAQFIRSMISFESKFDQAAPGNFAMFTNEELMGKELFEQNCNICHIPPHFGSTPANNGLDEYSEDPGMAGWFTDLPFFTEGAFKSPTLRNIEVTAPYMHDGRFETLEEVVDFYSEEIQPAEASFFQWIQGPDFTGFDFSDTEKAALVKFMKTLTDQNFLTHEKWSDPFPENPVETNQLPLLESINIFPNPFLEFTTLKIDNPKGKRFDLTLTTVEGRIIKTDYMKRNQYQLDREDLTPGLYLLEIKNENRVTTKKLIVQ